MDPTLCFGCGERFCAPSDCADKHPVAQLLPCGHSLCSLCVDAILLADVNACPLCAAAFDVYETDYVMAAANIESELAAESAELDPDVRDTLERAVAVLTDGAVSLEDAATVVRERMILLAEGVAETCDTFLVQAAELHAAIDALCAVKIRDVKALQKQRQKAMDAELEELEVSAVHMKSAAATAAIALERNADPGANVLRSLRTKQQLISRTRTKEQLISRTGWNGASVSAYLVMDTAVMLRALDTAISIKDPIGECYAMDHQNVMHPRNVTVAALTGWLSLPCMPTTHAETVATAFLRAVSNLLGNLPAARRNPASILVLPTVLSLMRAYGQCYVLQSFACGVLVNLSTDDAFNRTAARDCDATSLVCTAMRLYTHKAHLQGKACAFLSNVMFESPTKLFGNEGARMDVLACGGAEAVLVAMKTHKYYGFVQEAALRVLRYMYAVPVADGSLYPALAAADVIDAVCYGRQRYPDLLLAYNLGSVYCCIIFLGVLKANPALGVAHLLSSGALQVLYTAAESGVHENLCGMLCVVQILSIISEHPASCVHYGRGRKILQDAQRKFPSNRELQKHCAKALAPKLL